MTYFKKLSMMFVGIMGLLSAHALCAGEFGTKEEAVALVNRAIEHVHKVGKEKAFADFNDPKGAFVDRDLYISVYGIDGVRLAHGQNVKLIGKSTMDSVDVNGKAYGNEIMSVGTKGEGWVEYSFSDPITKKVLPKALYVKRDGDLIIGRGVYLR